MLKATRRRHVGERSATRSPVTRETAAGLPLVLLLLVCARAWAGGGQLGAAGDLYVSAGNRVVEFDGETGAFVGNFVQPGSGGLDEAQGLVFGPNGNLFVANRMQFLDTSDQILEFDGQTGAFIRALVPTGGGQNTGWLDSANHLLFRPDGRLLVASGDSESILAYDAGSVLNTPGASAPWLGVFATGGPPPSLRYPYTIRALPNGNVVVTSSYTGDGSDGHIIEYHGATGRLVRHFTDPFGMPYPVDVLARANGNLLVSYYYNGVYQFEGITGSFLGAFTQAGAQTVYAGMTLGPNGNLFVAGRIGINTQTIIQYNGATGALISTFVALPYTLLPSPHYLVFKPAPAEPTPAPSISEVSVTSHDACLPLAGVVITGANLSQPDTTVMLRKPYETAGYLGIITGATSTSLTVSFDLDHGVIATGAWDLVVAHADGQSGTLPGAIHITGCRAAHARNLLSTSWRDRGFQHAVAGIVEYDGQTGDAVGWLCEDHAESAQGELWLAPGIAIGPAGDVYVATGAADPAAGDGAHAIVRFDGITGRRVGVFVPAGAGGMARPVDVTFGPDGGLFVLHRLVLPPPFADPSGVLKFNGLSGAFTSQVMPLGACGLFDAQSVAFGPNGHLFISCDFAGVIEVDPATGACLGVFGQTQTLGDFLPTLSFSPWDNRLLVARGLADAVDGFSWPAGQLLGHFVTPGSGGLDVNPDIFDGTWDGRSGMAFGPDGNFFISSYFPQGVLQFSGTTGVFVGMFSSMTPGPDMVLGPESMDHELVFVPVVGDANLDWHVDLLDMREFQNCYSSQGVGVSNGNCLTWFDYDRDGHIASPDVAAFVEAFTGP